MQPHVRKKLKWNRTKQKQQKVVLNNGAVGSVCATIKRNEKNINNAFRWINTKQNLTFLVSFGLLWYRSFGLRVSKEYAHKRKKVGSSSCAPMQNCPTSNLDINFFFPYCAKHSLAQDFELWVEKTHKNSWQP